MNIDHIFTIFELLEESNVINLTISDKVCFNPPKVLSYLGYASEEINYSDVYLVDKQNKVTKLNSLVFNFDEEALQSTEPKIKCYGKIIIIEDKHYYIKRRGVFLYLRSLYTIIRNNSLLYCILGLDKKLFYSVLLGLRTIHYFYEI